MAFNEFRNSIDAGKELVSDDGVEERKGLNYRAEPELETAVNVALALGRPLLVTGEPGCGKTELGYAIARGLGLSRVYYFITKSTSEARDLFYSYDAVRRFQAAQLLHARGSATTEDVESTLDVLNYIEYAALGRAIIDAHTPKDVAHLVLPEYPLPENPRQSVVIVDEIDKAPRDFPNDLLHELDGMRFRVPELAVQLATKTDESRQASSPIKPLSKRLRPIVVITSNSERQLPEAFLRRCVYHHIAFPTRQEVLIQIIEGRLKDDFKEFPHETVSSIGAKVIRVVQTLRNSDSMEVKPSTAQLLNYIGAACAMWQSDPQKPVNEILKETGSAIIKTSGDGKVFRSLIDNALAG